MNYNNTIFDLAIRIHTFYIYFYYIYFLYFLTTVVNTTEESFVLDLFFYIKFIIIIINTFVAKIGGTLVPTNR